MATGKFPIALIQMAVSMSKETNIERACQLITNAAKEGAKLICLPEFFNSPYGPQYVNQYAEDIPGKTSTTLSEVAKNNEVYVVGGSFPERENSKLFNTCLVFGPNGQILAKHRKIHLFDIDIPGKITFKESDFLDAGNSFTVFDASFLRIGIGICYDIRFPLLANLYADRGCHLLVYPGAFNMTTGSAHWELLQRSRAVDNQLYVATISPARDENASYVVWGHSSVVDPWGSVMTKADEKERTIHAEIDMKILENVRQQIPLQKQKRNDLYQLITPSEAK